MSEWDDLHFAGKRNVKEINLRLAEVGPGSVVTAYIRSESYGPFTVSGSVTAGESQMVGAHEIGFPGRPSRDLWRLELEPIPTPQADGKPVMSELGHGDLVRGTFTQAPYGEFTIFGVIVAAPNGEDLLVGSWIVRDSGETAKRLLNLQVVAKRGVHSVPIPARMTVWPSARESANLTAPNISEFQLEIDTDQ